MTKKWVRAPFVGRLSHTAQTLTPKLHFVQYGYFSFLHNSTLPWIDDLF